MYSKCSQLGRKPELRNLKLLKGVYVFLIITLIVMPQYFGIHLGYDLTCTRASNLLIILYMFMCPMIMTHFWKTSLRCSVIYPLMMYLFVGGYTMIFRTDVNAFFMILLEILTFFMLIYGIRFVIGYRKALKFITGCAYFLAIYGFMEYAYGQSIFLKVLATVPNKVFNSYRSGHYRIMGPCGHSLGYGLLLIILIAVISYDPEKDEMYLFRKPVLLLLLLGNVFLNGSRSTLGIVALECFLILLFSRGMARKKTVLIASLTLAGTAMLLFLLQNTGVGRYLLGQIMSVLDHLLGTDYAAKYGVDSTTLDNSTRYREALPLIFTLDWLNPILGRGSHFRGAEIQGVYIHSIDNYYVSQYIKYAYPGLVCYVLFLLTTCWTLVREIVQQDSGLAKMTLIGAGCYFFNLWWVDALQTLKFVYLLLAVFFAYQLERQDLEKRMHAMNKVKVSPKEALKRRNLKNELGNSLMQEKFLSGKWKH